MKKIFTLFLLMTNVLLYSQELIQEDDKLIYISDIPETTAEDIKNRSSVKIKSHFGITEYQETNYGLAFNWKNDRVVTYKKYKDTFTSRVDVFIKDNKIKIQFTDITHSPVEEHPDMKSGSKYEDEYPSKFTTNLLVRSSIRKQWIKFKQNYYQQVKAFCQKIVSEKDEMDF